MEYDFGGYATKHGIKCSDGRTIVNGAFKDSNGQKVPLVWQHLHNDPGNVLGHATLEARQDGVYAKCKFNNSPAAKNAKELVQHGDVNALSIYANQLIQKGGDVVHGVIREVSLVLSGANPGALIDNLSLQHGDTSEIVDDEAIIYTDAVIAHAEAAVKTKEPEVSQPAQEKTVQDVFDTLTEEQKNVVYYMIGQALESADDIAEHSTDQEDTLVHKNIFEGYNTNEAPSNFLSHSQIQEIFSDAKKCGSLKESFLAHAQAYGIENIDLLFPDAKSLTNEPQFLSRRMEWVSKVLNGTAHTPFSRIKSIQADITEDEARAKGYIKGNLKKDEVFKLLKRETMPQTIYKKQKLDRDDIIDITDLNVVAWLKAEMRVMLDEEIARAVLIGDGRDLSDHDSINPERIRPIATENELYATRVVVTPESADTATADRIEAIIRSRKHYKGRGTPTFFTTSDVLTDMLLLKDKMGRRLYRSVAELAAELRVDDVVEVEVMENHKITDPVEGTAPIIGILVNLKDYTIGADSGGAISMFDDFDIDYNQYKYLMETRISGALTVPKSAIVFVGPYTLSP